MRVTYLILCLVLVTWLALVDAAPSATVGGVQRFRSLRKSPVQASVYNQRRLRNKVVDSGKIPGGAVNVKTSTPIPQPAPNNAAAAAGSGSAAGGGASAAVANGAAAAASNARPRPPALNLNGISRQSSSSSSSPASPGSPPSRGDMSPHAYSEAKQAYDKRVQDYLRSNIEGTHSVESAHATRGRELDANAKQFFLNQADDKIEEGNTKIKEGIKECLGSGVLGKAAAVVCSSVYNAVASPATLFTKSSKGIHQAIKDDHDGKSAWHITKGVATSVGVPVAKATATIASAGAAAGAENVATEVVQTVVQDMATEAATGAAKNLLTPSPPSSPTNNASAKQGGNARVSAAAAAGHAPPANSAAGAAKKSLLALKSRVLGRAAASKRLRVKSKTPSTDVIALASQFNASGAARVKLAKLLASAAGRVNLGNEANAALRRIGLPVTPLSAVDVVRTFLRVKYASGTISIIQWKQAEAQLNDPKVQQATAQIYAKAAQTVQAVVAAAAAARKK